jgi:8-oxo-dGTP pyrophosphatase MutT (NUDIX family)
LPSSEIAAMPPSKPESHRIRQQIERLIQQQPTPPAIDRASNGVASKAVAVARPSDWPAETSYALKVIPQLPDGRLVLVIRYRPALGKWSVEFPRGLAHIGDEGWKQAAEKRLREDAGMTCAQMALIGAIDVDAQRTASSVLVVIARGCGYRQPPQAGPSGPIAGSVPICLTCLDDLIRQGDIGCGMTLAALSLYRALPTEAS